jgi:tRNA threonylcarbamoyladenosine biosynthesis protein TsaE
VNGRTPSLQARTKSVDDTRALAAELAPLARAGDIIVLAGDLGTGKTAFTQGFARGLGVTDAVTSPTFTLVHPYQGRLRLLHADVYRLDRLHEVVDLGLVEQLDDHAAVACIEWGDLAEPVLPADFLEVRLGYCEGDEGTDDERTVAFRIVGPGWAPRRVALERAVSRWLTGQGE